MRDFSTGAGACYHDRTRGAGSRVTGKAALVSMGGGGGTYIRQLECYTCIQSKVTSFSKAKITFVLKTIIGYFEGSSLQSEGIHTHL